MRLIAAMALLVCAAAQAAAPTDRYPDVAAAYWVEVDGRPLWAGHADQRLPMASLTKLMTALIAVEHGDLDSRVEVSAGAAAETGTRLGLRRGEKLTRRDLLLAALVRSANDACRALADSIGATADAHVSTGTMTDTRTGTGATADMVTATGATAGARISAVTTTDTRTSTVATTDTRTSTGTMAGARDRNGKAANAHAPAGTTTETRDPTGAFVARMNARAAELGLADTHYTDPCGHDDAEQYTSARDLAALSHAVLAEPVLAEAVQRRELRLTTVAGRVLSARTTNPLLDGLPGARGLKTGTTPAAGRCLVAVVERDGRRVLVVLLHAPERWWDSVGLVELAFDAVPPRAAPDAATR
ncbi:MAG TPA: hypothetical protein VM847_08675 [Tahibacter sp.]|nr:hypothetical protein [Tahibacter sp.]